MVLYPLSHDNDYMLGWRSPNYVPLDEAILQVAYGR